MGQITLVVTGAELRYYNAGHASQAQIALRSPSPDLAPGIKELTSSNRAKLILGSCVTLVAGDPGAIWRAHNEDTVEDFDALFDLLARRPDREMRFLCDLEWKLTVLPPRGGRAGSRNIERKEIAA